MVSKRLLTGVLVLTLVVAPAAGQAPAEPAELAIEQPHYISNDVSREQANGTPVYVVRGGTLDIVPQNFRPTNVVDATVAPEGSLTYDSELGQYTLTVPANGTYTVAWIVSREIEREVVRNNTTVTETVTVSRRYEARIRVVGGVAIQHLPSEEINRLKSDAAFGADVRAALEQIREQNPILLDPSISDEAMIQEALNVYRLTKSPFRALTGRFTTVQILLWTSLGGLLSVLLYVALPTRILLRLRRRLNVFETAEAEEGQLKDYLQELRHREDLQIAANTSPHEVFGDDHIGGAFAETFGGNVRDATVNMLSVLRPRNLMAYWAQAAAQQGYRAVPKDDAPQPDGGEAAFADDSLTVARTAEGHALDDIEPDDDLLAALDWHALMDAVDIATADFDPDAISVTPTLVDLEALTDAYDVDLRHFRDDRHFGTALKQFVAAVRNHPTATTIDGDLDDLQHTLESFLQAAQVADDRYGFPVADAVRSALERALADATPEERAQETLNQP